MNLPRSPDALQISAAEPAGPVPISETQQVDTTLSDR